MFVDKIFLHFYDLHFLAEKAVESMPIRVTGEMRLATRLAVLSGKQVLVPASSFLESGVCSRILEEYLSILGLGVFSLVGNAASLIEFCEEKILKYDEGSEQRKAYESALRKELVLPFRRRLRSSTKDICANWVSKLDDSTVPALLEGCRVKIPKDVEERWQQVPMKLGDRAFIVQYVTPLLFDTTEVNRAVINRLHTVINRAYFASYLAELGATVIGDLVYLDSPYFETDDHESIPYRFVVTELKMRNKLKWLIECSVEELLLFRQSDEWKGIFYSAVASKEQQGSLRDQFERYLLGKECRRPETDGNIGGLRDLTIIKHQEVTMGDKYTAGQVGAQGPKAKAKDMSFTHIGSLDQSSIDLHGLSDELGQLRDHLKTIADSPEHDVAIGYVATAQLEATKGSWDGTVAALAKAGRWALDAAKNIGLGIAASALAKSMGV